MSAVDDKLRQMVGFDPAKRPNLSKTVIDSVLLKLSAERQALAEQDAEKVLREAFTLAETKKKLDGEYAKACEKHDKALGQLLRRVEAGLQGKEAPAEGEAAGAAEPTVVGPGGNTMPPPAK